MKKLITLILLATFSFQVQSATLTRQNLSDSATALEATYSNATVSGGDVATNTDGKLLLHVKNPGSSTATVTVTAQKTTVIRVGYGTLTRADIVASLDAGEEAFMGPFPIDAFNTASGNAAITYSGDGAADVDIAALKIP